METNAPWHQFRLYKRNVLNISDLLCIEVKNNKVEEKVEKEKSQEDILHEYRDKINNYEKHLTNDKNWEYYKKIVNPYELIFTQKKYNDFPESICLLKPLSRSYFKMLEILDLVSFFDNIKNETIKTSHICEGPGGFVEAIYDRSTTYRKPIHSSLAMTLRSKQTNVPGWKRATQFLQKHRNIKIIYGHDGTGDILKPENQEEYIIQQKNKSLIFTSDGGFDFSVDYTKQEDMIFPLLLSSSRIGLEVLKKGGLFVMKIFDFYRKSTQDLIYLLSCHFSSWTLYKPATSRPCNPEHYFIGKDFTGISETTLDYFRLWINEAEMGIERKQLFSDTFEYPETFKETINNLRNTSFKKQIEYLEKVFAIIETNDSKIIKEYFEKNRLSSYEWCKQFKVPIYLSHSRAIEELYNGQQVVYQ